MVDCVLQCVAGCLRGGEKAVKGTNNVTVRITPEGHIPLPFDLQEELGLAPQCPVTLRAEGRALVVEQASRFEVLARLEQVMRQLRTGEPFERIWEEIEAGRNEEP